MVLELGFGTNVIRDNVPSKIVITTKVLIMFIISTKTIGAKLNITKDLEEMSLQEYNKTIIKM
jgi:hypothetical protein